MDKHQQLNLGFGSHEIAKEIEFKQNNEVEGFQIWKFKDQESIIKHDKIPDDPREIGEWLEKVRHLGPSFKL
jgi:hypothetical protein